MLDLKIASSTNLVESMKMITFVEDDLLLNCLNCMDGPLATRGLCISCSSYCISAKRQQRNLPRIGKKPPNVNPKSETVGLNYFLGDFLITC